MVRYQTAKYEVHEYAEGEGKIVNKQNGDVIHLEPDSMGTLIRWLEYRVGEHHIMNLLRSDGSDPDNDIDEAIEEVWAG